MPKLFSSSHETQNIKLLRGKLDNFYAKVPDYTVFLHESNQIQCWDKLIPLINKVLEEKEYCRILEVGSGRSGFGNFLSKIGLKNKVFLASQDVTDQNKSFLLKISDRVYIEDVKNIDESFDIIFSTYVLEHVVNPEDHLNHLYSLLENNGMICIFCPRYDFPFYLPPSTRHLGIKIKVFFSFKHILVRINSLLTNKYYFLVHDDLACFHGPFFRDSDAVHWVSKLDIQLYAKKKKLKADFIEMKADRFTKNWVIKKFLTLAVSLKKEI